MTKPPEDSTNSSADAKVHTTKNNKCSIKQCISSYESVKLEVLRLYLLFGNYCSLLIFWNYHIA